MAFLKIEYFFLTEEAPLEKHLFKRADDSEHVSALTLRSCKLILSLVEGKYADAVEGKSTLEMPLS